MMAFVLLVAIPFACAEDLFSSKPIWSSGTSRSGGDGIARFIDFDKDGDLDFVTSAPDPMRWVLHKNEDGVIAQKTSWESEQTTDCDHIDVLDFNQDGWNDLVGTHESHCTIYLNHEGTFGQKPDWETGIIANANQIDFGDVDHDGDLDMVMAAGEPINGVALFENTTGMPSKTPTRKLGHMEYTETAIFAQVINDDTLNIVAGYRGGRIMLYRSAKGAWDDGRVLYEDPSNAWTQRLYWHDLNRDKQFELYCAKGPWSNRLGTSLRLTPSSLPDPMKVRWKSDPDTAFHGFTFGDVDGDGDTDVLASDYAHGGHLFLYLNHEGTLPEKPSWSVNTHGPAHEAVLGDIDGDGDLDLAVGCQNQAHIYENLSQKRVP